jgi:hypothetical protein
MDKETERYPYACLSMYRQAYLPARLLRHRHTTWRPCCDNKFYIACIASVSGIRSECSVCNFYACAHESDDVEDGPRRAKQGSNLVSGPLESGPVIGQDRPHLDLQLAITSCFMRPRCLRPAFCCSEAVDLGKLAERHRAACRGTMPKTANYLPKRYLQLAQSECD